MERNRLQQTLSLIAGFYDNCKVGYQGCQGYRKSTDLAKLSRCIEELVSLRLIDPGRTVFADLGCADGRVNVLAGYFVRRSLGIEIDADIAAEFSPHFENLGGRLRRANLLPVPGNIGLFVGDSLKDETYAQISTRIGIRFSDIDLFYTYITLHDLFAEKIARDGKKGALYLVYGFSTILPRYRGLEILIPDVASQGIVALYRKREG
jgi:hypothetical protein